MPESKGHAYELVAHVARHSEHDAWVHINPARSSALFLAISARIPFLDGEFGRIVNDFNGQYWLGEDREAYYASACRNGNVSAAKSIERWFGRGPFIVDGERVYVGAHFQWENVTHRCTSIERDLVRAKVIQGNLPATLKTIPREGFEAQIAARKAADKARRDAEKEAQRADPISLIPLDQHFAREVTEVDRLRYGHRCHIPGDMIRWAADYGTDYERAYKECEHHYWIGTWLEVLGCVQDSAKLSDDIDKIRKNYTWSKVQQATWRLVRTARGLPLKDTT